MSWRVVAWGVAVATAALGAWLYVAAPGVATYWLSFFLMLPLWLGLFGVLGDRLPLRVHWVGAALLAAAGVASYLVWPNADWWSFGQLAIVPLVVLIIKRGTQRECGSGLGGSDPKGVDDFRADMHAESHPGRRVCPARAAPYCCRSYVRPLVAAAVLALPQLAALVRRHSGDHERRHRVEPPRAECRVAHQADQQRRGQVGAEHVLRALAGGCR